MSGIFHWVIMKFSPPMVKISYIIVCWLLRKHKLYHFEVIYLHIAQVFAKDNTLVIIASVWLRTRNLNISVLKKFKKASLNLRRRDQEFSSSYADAMFSFNFQGNPKVQLGFSKILTFYTNSRGSWLTPQTCTFKV